MKPTTRITDDDLVKLQKPLSHAHGGKAGTEVDDLWSVRVMGHIRSLPPIYPGPGYLENLQQLVWRLSPVAIALVLMLGAAVFQLDFTSEYELATMFAEDPLDLSLLGEYMI